MMTGRRLTWNKSYGAKWRDEASDLLGGVARAARALLGDLATLESGSDVGWAVDDRGLAYTPARLARLLGFPEEQVAEALEQLLAAGVACRVDGRLGLIGWLATQEDPSAERQRRRRERDGGQRQDGGVTPTVTVTPSVTRESPQKTEDRGQRTEPVVVTAGARAPAQPMTPGQRLSLARRQAATPTTERRLASRVGLSIEDIRAFEADERPPTRGELEAIARELGDPELLTIELPERDETVVETVVRAEAAARGLLALAQALGRWPSDDEAGAEPRPVVRTAAEAMRLVYAPGEGLQTLPNWLVVISRMLEECRRQFEQKGSSSSAEYLRLEYLVKPKHRGRLMADKDLDERRDSTPKNPRASPRGGRRPLPPVNKDLEPDVQEG